jgi:kynurenine formamidase
MGTPGRHSRGFEFADDLVLLPTQCATQIDALAHVSYDGEIYNGHRFETVGADGAKVLGVERFRTGIQGRGVLLDFPRLFGMDRLEGGRCITVRDMEACLKAQSVRAGEGDILLLRTGWIQLFLDHGDRDAYMASEPGIGLEVTEWLHRNGIAFVASDTFGVEVVPEEGRGEVMPVHCVLVRDMGMPLGEMFDLEAVAAQCERSGRWEFLFSCLPLPITGGVGSPVAPIATF